MKKILSSFLILLVLTSCGSKPTDTVQTGNLLQTAAFELYYPKDWSEIKNEIDFATVYSIDSLKLVSFSRAPGEGMGKTVLSFEDTYSKFEAAFLKEATPEKVTTKNDIDMEIIKYKNVESSFIFNVSSQSGTVAIWNNGKTSYALIDQSDMHQSDGDFKSVYESFKYLQ